MYLEGGRKKRGKSGRKEEREPNSELSLATLVLVEDLSVHRLYEPEDTGYSEKKGSLQQRKPPGPHSQYSS